MTNDILGGYTVSSGGVRLHDAPESYTIKLDENGKLQEITVDEGKTTNISVGSLSSEMFKNYLNKTQEEINKVAENQGGLVQE